MKAPQFMVKTKDMLPNPLFDLNTPPNEEFSLDLNTIPYSGFERDEYNDDEAVDRSDDGNDQAANLST